MLQLRLLGCGAVRGGGERVDAGQALAGAGEAAQEFGAPVHRDEGLAQPGFAAGLHRQHDGAAPGGDVHQVAFLQQPARHVLRMQLHRRLGHVAEQAAQRAGAAHAVPLVAQAPGGEREGIARIARLGQRLVLHVGEAGLAVGVGNTPSS